MGLNYLLDLLWSNRKELIIRESAEKFLKNLREKQTMTIDEAKQVIGHIRTYYKVVNKLKDIGLIRTYRDPETKKLLITISVESYKFFVKKYLLEEVEEFFKVRS